ncbi:MAG: TonB-dependent receptor [Acidobacteria bacterium]|nr:TonB-dependent receptor [Acidobacteriota bacterium]MCI0627984.1 TonB-dependent receptor [Acidobacteriota bacterium]MCI0725092.1 TonB-dependent receptor [Acidobacteriota bacterium]
MEDSSGAVISGVHINLKSLSGERMAETTSDAQGWFAFEALPAGGYWLSAISQGFDGNEVRAQISGGQTHTMVIRLAVSGRKEQMVVSANRTEAPLSLATSSVTLITAEEIEGRQANSALEVLRDVPGLSVVQTSRRGGTTSVFTRGAGANFNLVLIDGAQVNEPGGGFNFAHLTTANIDRIEVVRGPQSSLYGSDAAGSVIQIFTKRGEGTGKVPRGTVSVEAGSYGTVRAFGLISGGLGSRFDYSSGIEGLNTSGAFVNDAYHNTVISGNYGYRANERAELRGSWRYGTNHVGVPNKVGFGVIDTDASRESQLLATSLSYRHRLTESFTQRGSVGISNFDDLFLDPLENGPFTVRAILTGTAGARGKAGVRIHSLLSPEQVAAGNFVIPPGGRLVTRTVRLAATPLPSISETQRITTDYQGEWTWRTNQHLLFGHEFEQERGTTSSRNVVRNNHGTFLESRFSWDNRLFFTTGVRLEKNSAFGFAATPRASVGLFLKKPSTGWFSSTRLKGNFGLGITEPSFLNNFSDAPTFVGNPDLLPEQATSFDGGIEQTFFDGSLAAQGTFFNNQFRNLITFVSLPPPQRSTWFNIGAARARGVELALRWSRFRKLSASGSYTFLHTVIQKAALPSSASTGVGQELARRPRHSGALNLDCELGKLLLNLNGTFVGERQDSDGIGLGATRLPGYIKVDVGGSYPLSARLTYFARIENVLNQRYEEVFGFSALPINFLTGMRFSLGKLK